MDAFIVIGSLFILGSLGGLYLVSRNRIMSMAFIAIALFGLIGLTLGLRSFFHELYAENLWYRVKSGEMVLIVRTNNVTKLPNPIVTKNAVYYWTLATMQFDNNDPADITVDLLK